jgi:hypothetical protein
MGAMPVSGVTIAFESIDGPPPDVFQKLVASLNDEAQARRIPVVSREAAATYRVRGYVAASTERGKTSFDWVWDIYDAEKRRTLRIAGEQRTAAGPRRDAWAAADETVLRRIASDGMERVAAFLNTPASPAVPSAEPELPAVTLAAMRDDSPEAAGIVRLLAPAETTGAAPASEDAAAGPLPRSRPKSGPPAKRPAVAAALPAGR